MGLLIMFILLYLLYMGGGIFEWTARILNNIFKFIEWVSKQLDELKKSHEN